MCRLYLNLTTIPKTRFPAFIQLRMNPNPMFKRLTSSMLPVLKNHLETTLSGACFSALRSYMSAKVIPCFQTTPHTGSKCLRCSSPESSQVPRIRTHTLVCVEQLLLSLILFNLEDLQNVPDDPGSHEDRARYQQIKVISVHHQHHHQEQRKKNFLK